MERTSAHNRDETTDLVRSAEDAGRSTHFNDVWLSVDDPRMPPLRQGWKIHVSARPSTLWDTVRHALPVLLSTTCSFKVARTSEVLRDLNAGANGPGAVGKALTVYPPQGAVVDIARSLVTALSGFAGPAIGSDRRVSRDAPVYYRYGPFTPQYRFTENGDPELVVYGPDGQQFPGAAGARYRCPDWVQDPFVGSAPAEAAIEGRPLLGKRYALTSGVARAAHGNVYRAIDTTTDASVVIKQARAHVVERADGSDCRTPLRHGGRVLLALADVDGVPRVVDHFRHGADEFLVTTSLGHTDLRQEVIDRGTYVDDDDTGRHLGVLAEQLVSLLDAIHARGVVLRDLTPKNIVLDENGRIGVVDFDNSRMDGVQHHGWTPGYAPPGQRHDVPATIGDDYFALGTTLFYAATGLDPVCMNGGPDDEGAREQAARDIAGTVTALAAVHPHGGGVVDVISGLLDLEPEARAKAVEVIRTGRHRRRGRRPPRSSQRRTGSLSVVSREQLEAVAQATLEECVGYAGRLMMHGGSQPGLTSAYRGSAGVGLELLHHAGDADVRSVVAELARWTCTAGPPEELPPGLIFGRTGTAVFLAAASRVLEELATDAVELRPWLAPAPLTGSECDDYSQGLAGIGTGSLVLHALTDDGRHLAHAGECARRLVAGTAPSVVRDLASGRPEWAVAVEQGLAHGVSGIASFLLAYERSGAPPVPGLERCLDEALGEILSVTPGLVAASGGRAARPMSASWCQGLAGIGTTLVDAALAKDDQQYLQLAREAGRACLSMAPRMKVVSQCCGMAGVGELLLDLGAATGEDEFVSGARHVLTVMLARCAGDAWSPRFPDHSVMSSSGEWGAGSGGVLSFLRRLRDGEGQRLWTARWQPPVLVDCSTGARQLVGTGSGAQLDVGPFAAAGAS